MRESNDPLCRLCNIELETPFHILMECEALERKRLAVHSKYIEMENNNLLNYKKRKRWSIEFKRTDTIFIDFLLDLIKII